MKTGKLNQLYLQMILYDNADPKRIQHLVKVHSFAKLIGELEGIEEQTLFVLEAAAYTHDIGIRKAEELYGCSNGKYQEELGPDLAEEMMSQLKFEKSEIERVRYLVGHHHTYSDIKGVDYQILVEADFLVNLYEDGAKKETVENAYRRIFKTESGKKICREMFGL